MTSSETSRNRNFLPYNRSLRLVAVPPPWTFEIMLHSGACFPRISCSQITVVSARKEDCLQHFDADEIANADLHDGMRSFLLSYGGSDALRSRSHASRKLRVIRHTGFLGTGISPASSREVVSRFPSMASRTSSTGKWVILMK